MSTNINVIAPFVAPENRAYWDAANQEKLILKRCDECESFHWYPRLLCPFCGSSGTRWIDAKGTGSIYSFSVIRGTPAKVAAYITLDEGVTIASLISCDNVDQVTIGARVEVSYSSVITQDEIEQKVPVFTLCDA